MTVKEFVQAEWSIDQLTITVRQQEHGRYIMEYRIGKDSDKYLGQLKYLYTTPVGDMYEHTRGQPVMIINRIIQHHQLEKLPKGQEMYYGVLVDRIPEELLNLEIHSFAPTHCTSQYDGYSMECYTDNWHGIKGENEQIELDDLIESERAAG